MRVLFVSILFVVVSVATHAQSNNDLMISGGLDLIKTDFNDVFEKAQLGLEANYFVLRNFSAGAGVDVWTDIRLPLLWGHAGIR